MILAITESHVPLTIQGLGSLLTARVKKERIREYDSQLVYMLVKAKYKSVTPPHEFAEQLLKPPPKPMSKKDIIAGLRKKLG